MDTVGTIIIFHNKPHTRVTEEPRGQEVCYVCPEIIQYFCLRSYTLKAALQRVRNITELILERAPLLILYPVEKVINTSADMIEALQNTTP